MNDDQPPYTITPDILSRVAAIGEATPQVAPQVTPQVGDLVTAIGGPMSRDALQTALGLRDRKSFRERYLQPAIAAGLIEMTRPDKPNSRLQQYRLTERGRHWLTQPISPATGGRP